MDEEPFKKPIGKKSKGLYITEVQLRFFLNRSDGEQKFLNGDPEFSEYFFKSAVCNLISDLLEREASCASLYWDPDQECVGMSFPLKGIVMEEFKKRKIDCFFEGK